MGFYSQVIFPRTVRLPLVTESEVLGRTLLAEGRRTMIAAYGLNMIDFERLQTIPDVIRWVPMRVFPQEIRRFERMHNGRLVGLRLRPQDLTGKESRDRSV